MKTVKDFIYPRNFKCPVCKKSMNKSQIVLNFGVMQRTGKDGACMIDTNKALLFMSLGKHNEDDSGAHVYICDDVPSSQIDMHWCSTKCFKKYFTMWANKLDAEASH